MSPEGPDSQLTDPWLAADIGFEENPARMTTRKKTKRKMTRMTNDEDGDDGYSE